MKINCIINHVADRNYFEIYPHKIGKRLGQKMSQPVQRIYFLFFGKAAKVSVIRVCASSIRSRCGLFLKSNFLS